MTRADLSKDPNAVAKMFDEVAHRYDLTNDVLAAGQTRAWRRAVVRALNVQSTDHILDLAAGTGTSTTPIQRAGADAVACDFSLGMLRAGRTRNSTLSFVAGDALRLPFADGAFDAVTISFGLRNVVDTSAALAEMRRVTRLGGRLVICEFTTPRQPALRTLYREYLLELLPAVARAVSSNPAAYEYLAESILSWPSQQDLCHVIQRSGWSDVQWRDLSMGIVALHRAVNLPT